MKRSRRKRTFRGYNDSRLSGRLVLGAVIVVIAAGIVTFGIRSRGQKNPTGADGKETAVWAEQGEQTGQSEESSQQTKNPPVVFSDFQAGGVSLSGLSAGPAEEKLRTAYDWDLKVVNGDEKVPVRNLTGAWLEETAEKIKNAELQESGSIEPDYAGMEAELQTIVRELGSRWDKGPVNSQVEAYDKNTKVYTYSQEKNGRTLNQEALVKNLMNAVRTGNLKAEIQPEFTETAPVRNREQAKKQYRVIGNFSTKTTDNKNRNQNIRLAAEAIDGMVLQPGQEFSFNTTTGNRTSEKGYQPAGAYKNGVLIEEPGGGVCQVSTTLYHAILGAGYKTTERNAHSFAPTYVQQGQDAMVSFDGYAGPDLKFVNSGSASVVLRASFDGKNLKMSIVGLPVLEEGVTVAIRSEKVKDSDAPEPVYEENPSLPFGTERIVEQGKSGSVWKSYRITSKNGEVLKEEPLHNSYYKSKAAVIHKNTLTPPPETETAAGDAAGENPMGENPAGENPSGQNPVGANPLEQNPAGDNPLIQDPLTQNPAAGDTTGVGPGGIPNGNGNPGEAAGNPQNVGPGWQQDGVN